MQVIVNTICYGRTQFPRHKCLRGIPDDLIVFHLSNLLIVKPATIVADYESWPHAILKRTTRVRLNIGCGVWTKSELSIIKLRCIFFCILLRPFFNSHVMILPFGIFVIIQLG